MKCPKCGKSMRQSKKHPGYYLCDNCRKRYPGSTNKTSTSPKRASRKKSKKRKKSKFPTLFLLLLFLAAIGFFLFKSGMFSPDTSGTAKEPNTTSFSAEETGTLEGIEVKILSSKKSSGRKAIKPSHGNSFLLIEVEISNTTDAPISINDITNFDASYQDAPLTHSASAYEVLTKKQPRLTGTIEPNEVLTGFVCYEVPSDFDKINLEFNYPVWYNQKISFSITP